MSASPEDKSSSGGSWLWNKLSPVAPNRTNATMDPGPAREATVTEAMPMHLKSIKTPHGTISHPELAFSPTDIGIWEVSRGTPRAQAPEESRKPSEGFKSWTNLFGKGS